MKKMKYLMKLSRRYEKLNITAQRRGLSSIDRTIFLGRSMARWRKRQQRQRRLIVFSRKFFIDRGIVV
jgi:hypothetical protein